MRKKSKGIRTAQKILGLGFLVLLLLGSFGWVYRSNFITGSLKVELAMQGEIDHNQRVSAVFANEEIPIQAPAAGTPEFLGKEGQRFRKGEPIAIIRAEGVAPGQNSKKGEVSVSAPVGGLVYYETDGLESILTPTNFLTMDLSKALVQSSQPNRIEGMVQNGGSIGKIVDNLRPTVAFVKIVPTAEHELGKYLKFIINDQTYNAKIVRLLEEPQGIVIQFSQYIEGTAKQREQDIFWVTRPKVKGVIIPKGALWNKGEEQGAYVVLDGVLQFRKVKVLDENEQNICVEGLPHGIPVVTNPRSGLDGLTINVKKTTNP